MTPGKPKIDNQDSSARGVYKPIYRRDYESLRVTIGHYVLPQVIMGRGRNRHGLGLVVVVLNVFEVFVHALLSFSRSWGGD